MYRDFKLDQWEDFHRCIQGRELYIWGAGANGQEIADSIKKFSSRWHVCGFLESDSRKTNCGRYSVFTPDILASLDCESYVVLISTNRPGKIAQQLEKLGTKYYFSYFWLNTTMRDFRQQDIGHDIMESLNEILSDQKSKELLRLLAEKRRLGFLDYTDIQDIGTEYFREEFFLPTEDEVFIDAGAYDGDTIEEFVDWTKNRYEKIYSFEPDVRMAEKIKKKMHRWHDVELINKGLWSSQTNLPFVVDNKIYSSHIQMSSGGVQTSVECISLDEILAGQRCSFIKMDIEGAEQQALLGARKTIMKYKPRLAICIYHLPDDLWKIPLVLHEWVPEYEMYIRHCGCRYFSTILYAACK